MRSLRHWWKRKIAKVPEYSIGIDFGTTTSRIAYVDNFSVGGGAYPPMLPPAPSLIHVSGKEGDYKWAIGEAALNQPWFYSKFKLHMANREPMTATDHGGTSSRFGMHAEILAARVISELTHQAVEKVSGLVNCKDLVITVPAEWNAKQRQATVLAGKIAGFSKVLLLEEPVAAYLALSSVFANDVVKRAKNILMFDYGGGTLDITLIHKPDNGLPYVAGRSMDDKVLGGEHLDRLVAEKIIGKDVWKTCTPREKSFLARQVARPMKELLNPTSLETERPASATNPKSVEIRSLGITYPEDTLKLKRQELDNIMAEYMGRFQTCLDAAINIIDVKKEIFKEASLDKRKKEIDAVFMVGGSSYLRKVQETVLDYFDQTEFGQKIFLEQPEKVVAYGAALYKSYRDHREKRFSIRMPMKTYVKIPGGEDIVLGDVPESTLPIKSKKPPKAHPVPETATEIYWKVYQKHTYGDDEPDVVQTVRFQKSNGQSERVRLNYEIDENACLSYWRPELQRDQNKVVDIGVPSEEQYHWADEDPVALAKKYSVNKKVDHN
jgi:molecular chaperone DnaK (HSP70)